MTQLEYVCSLLASKKGRAVTQCTIVRRDADPMKPFPAVFMLTLDDGTAVTIDAESILFHDNQANPKFIQISR